MLDIIKDIWSVAQNLMALKATLAAAKRERRQEIDDFFDGLSKCPSVVYASLKEKQAQHSCCAELEGYAKMLPATVGKEIGEERTQELSERLLRGHRV